MNRITLYAYQDAMLSLLSIIHLPGQYSNQDALNTLSLEEVILVEWRGRVTPQQELTWQLRPNSKKYAFTVAVSVAISLWKVLQRLQLSHSLQEFFDDLTKQLVNNGLQAKYLSFSAYEYP